LPDGGFSYWPDGTADGNDNSYTGWASNYAGHFLLEAEKRGYHVPPQMLRGWLNYQRGLAQRWTDTGRDSQITQAYRLYVLALANEPELGAMNRMREAPGLDVLAAWQLAAAYKLAGQSGAAETLSRSLSIQTASYTSADGTFGSVIRDRSIILNAMINLGRSKEMLLVAKSISEELNRGSWLSTQSAAFALMSFGKLVQTDTAVEKFSYQIALGAKPARQRSSIKPLLTERQEGFADAGEKIQIRNVSKNPIFVNVFVEGVQPPGQETDEASGFELSVNYTNTDGTPLDITSLDQGQEFVAKIHVMNRTNEYLRNVALTYAIPSGWELINPRLNSAAAVASAEVDFQDYRDDRVLNYFSIAPHKGVDISIHATAIYPGSYYLPGMSVEPMYDATKFARIKGQKVEVKRK